MPVVTLEQLRANKSRDSLYVLIHKKGRHLLAFCYAYGRVISSHV